DLAAIVGERARAALEIAECQRRRLRPAPRNEAGRLGGAGLRGQRRHQQERGGAREDAAPHGDHPVIGRVVIVYLNESGSRLSRRSPAVSACGYMRKPTFPARAFGSVTSCATLYA